MQGSVSLNLITHNPWQPRQVEDEAHIRKLAESIAESGLLQTPVGRVIKPGLGGLAIVIDPAGYGSLANCLENEPEARLQLAFGHSRLAAYKLLANSNPHVYSAMPVVAQVLSDERMFEMTISENVARKSLSPIEEARAMKNYVDYFQKTSAQVGRLFGIGDSAVRNKMRLLNLPEVIQAALGLGTITEGLARALLALYDLPEEFKNPDEIQQLERMAIAGEITPASLYRSVDAIRERHAPKMVLPVAEPALARAAAPTPMPAPVRLDPPAPPAWVDEEGEDDLDPDAGGDDGADEEEEKPAAVSMETAQPQPAAQAAPTLAEMGAALAAAAQASKTSTASWDGAQVVLTVTYMPLVSGEADRACIVSVKAGADAPVMKFTREGQVTLDGLLCDLLIQARDAYRAAHEE